MKRIACLIGALIFTISISPSVLCLNAEDGIIAEAQQGFFDSLDREVYGIFEQFGLDSFDGDEIFSKGTEGIKAYFTDTLIQKLRDASTWFFLGICIIMLLSVVNSAFDFSSSADALSLFSAAIVCTVTVGRLSGLVSCVASAMELNGKLMLSFIPVFALFISLSGNPASALTYNSLLLFFCEAVSLFLDRFFVSVTGLYFCSAIGFSFNPGVNLSRFINGANRLTSLILGMTATLFTGLLSLKNILAVSTDALSVKGVRFLLSSLVPIIGASMSEAYSSVLGSINLVKSSLAVIGIAGLVIINIPPLAEGVVWFFLISVLSCLSEILGLYRVSEIFRSLASCVRLLLLICFFQVFILIISIGIMITVRGGGNG